MMLERMTEPPCYERQLATQAKTKQKLNCKFKMASIQGLFTFLYLYSDVGVVQLHQRKTLTF